MPVRVAATSISNCGIVNFAIASRLPDKTVLNGSTFFKSGFFSTTAGTRSRQYIICVYIGCSTHVVPSWSKVAMRASGATNCGLLFSVVVFTNSTIAFLAAPSFQDGSGSVWADAWAHPNRNMNAVLIILFISVLFIRILLRLGLSTRHSSFDTLSTRSSTLHFILIKLKSWGGGVLRPYTLIR